LYVVSGLIFFALENKKNNNIVENECFMSNLLVP
jgi:hypothetical protein